MVLGIILLVIVSLITIINISVTEEEPTESNLEPKYQGPVPQGYDLQYFRETGITRRISE